MSASSASDPPILRIQFGPNAIRNGKVQVWASESLVKPLGNRRVVPQPASSIIGQGGILYTFPVSIRPASVEFEMEPASPGMSHLSLRVLGSETLNLTITVMP